MVQLDRRYPDVTTIDAGYRFWMVEYLYTKGVPANESVLKHFLDYLSSSTGCAPARTADVRKLSVPGVMMTGCC